MLEKLPHGVGEALSGLRAGLDETASHALFADVPATLSVTSDAFRDGGAIPARHTADGPGLSPPLAWAGVPAQAAAVVLLVEDADSPTPKPLVHAIAWDLPGGDGRLAEGDLAGPASEGGIAHLGRNAFLRAQYLPPDPPAGHGPHRYLFQVFALGRALALDGTPGRGAVLAAMSGHVLARGCLVGRYERP